MAEKASSRENKGAKPHSKTRKEPSSTLHKRLTPESFVGKGQVSKQLNVKKPNYKEWLGFSIRQSAFGLLNENPHFSTRKICEKLNLPYEKYKQYLWNCKSDWKTNHRMNKVQSVHSWRGCCVVPNGLDRVEAVRCGWLVTRARNRWLLWKDGIGRLEWFETGRVKLWVRKPASLGKACQLVSNGFFNTGLFSDVRVLEKVLRTVRFQGAHAVFETGQRLPKMEIRDFERSNGIVVKLGDASHPKAMEVEFHYPDWAERNERLFEPDVEARERLTLQLSRFGEQLELHLAVLGEIREAVKELASAAKKLQRDGGG